MKEYYTMKELEERLLKEGQIDKEELLMIINKKIKLLEQEIEEDMYLYKLATSFLMFLVKESKNGSNEP